MPAPNLLSVDATVLSAITALIVSTLLALVLFNVTSGTPDNAALVTVPSFATEPTVRFSPVTLSKIPFTRNVPPASASVEAVPVFCISVLIAVVGALNTLLPLVPALLMRTLLVSPPGTVAPRAAMSV